MTIVFENTDDDALPDPGDGARRADAARRADRARDRDVQRADPRRRRARRGRCSSSSPSGRELREWLPAARRHPAPRRDRAARRQRGAGRPSDDDEERLTREDDDHADRALPASSRSRPRRSTAFADGPGARSSSTTPTTRHDVDARRRRSAPSSSATSRDLTRSVAPRAASRSAGSTPTSRSRRSSTTATPGYDLCAARRRRRSRPRGGRALVPTGHRGRDPAGLRRVRAAALGARAAARRHAA